MRIGNAFGSAFTGVLELVEARMMLTAGMLLQILALVFALFPALLVYPLAVILTCSAHPGSTAAEARPAQALKSASSRLTRDCLRRHLDHRSNRRS